MFQIFKACRWDTYVGLLQPQSFSGFTIEIYGSKWFSKFKQFPIKHTRHLNSDYDHDDYLRIQWRLIFGNVLRFSTLQLWVAYFTYIKSWKYNSNKHVRKALVVWRVWEIAESWLVYKNKFLRIIQSYFLTGTIKKS